MFKIPIDLLITLICWSHQNCLVDSIEVCWLPLTKVKWNSWHLKMESIIQFCERLLVFDLNSQSNYTRTFCAPDAPCWLAGVVYVLVRGTMFGVHIECWLSKWETKFLWAQTLNGRLEDSEEQFAEFDKKCMGFELRTVPWSAKEWALVSHYIHILNIWICIRNWAFIWQILYFPIPYQTRSHCLSATNIAPLMSKYVQKRLITQ